MEYNHITLKYDKNSAGERLRLLTKITGSVRAHNMDRDGTATLASSTDKTGKLFNAQFLANSIKDLKPRSSSTIIIYGLSYRLSRRSRARSIIFVFFSFSNKIQKDELFWGPVEAFAGLWVYSGIITFKWSRTPIITKPLSAGTTATRVIAPSTKIAISHMAKKNWGSEWTPFLLHRRFSSGLSPSIRRSCARYVLPHAVLHEGLLSQWYWLSLCARSARSPRYGNHSHHATTDLDADAFTNSHTCTTSASTATSKA